MKASIIRIGDTVEIVEPKVFVRVGYPLTKRDIKDRLTRLDQKKIREFMQQFGLCQPLIMDFVVDAEYDVFNFEDHLGVVIYQKILDVISYGLLAKEKYGGNKRTIHTEFHASYKGRTGKVVGKRRVITGIRTMGEYVAYLSNQKSNNILKVELDIPKDNFIHIPDIFEIEAKNVRAV